MTRKASRSGSTAAHEDDAATNSLGARKQRRRQEDRRQDHRRQESRRRQDKHRAPAASGRKQWAKSSSNPALIEVDMDESPYDIEELRTEAAWLIENMLRRGIEEAGSCPIPACQRARQCMGSHDRPCNVVIELFKQAQLDAVAEGKTARFCPHCREMFAE